MVVSVPMTSITAISNYSSSNRFHVGVSVSFSAGFSTGYIVAGSDSGVGDGYGDGGVNGSGDGRCSSVRKAQNSMRMSQLGRTAHQIL
jgi:hypothetical protein